jgi:multiple sugar transport system permease protein
MKFVGLENYAYLLRDPIFWNSLKVTSYFAVVAVPVTIALGMVIAFLLNRDIKARAFYRLMVYLPVVTSMISVGIVWRMLYDPEVGLLNYLLSFVGMPKQNWLGDPKLAMPSLIVVSVWKDLGFNVIIFLAGLQGISRTYYDAAAIDGANILRQFRHITVPLLSPTTFLLFILNTISAFRVFGSVFVMTKGEPLHATNVISYAIYATAFGDLQFGYAAAWSWVLFFIIFILTMLNFRFGERKVHYQ